MSKTITPQYLSPLKICGGKTFLSPSFFLPFDLMKSLASSIPGAVISTTSTSMPRPSRIIKILPWCVTIWKKGGKFKIWFLQKKRVGKLPMFSKNRWKKSLSWLTTKVYAEGSGNVRNFKAIHELVVAFNLVTFSSSLENISRKTPKIKFLYSQVSQFSVHFHSPSQYVFSNQTFYKRQ